jgi:hypothetical protein
MGKAETLRSLRTGATANSINAQLGNDSGRTVSAIPSLIAAASSVGAQVRQSINPSSPAANLANARLRLIRFDTSFGSSVSPHAVSAAIVEAGSVVGTRSKPVLTAPEIAPPGKATEELLLQKLEALEKRIKGLEAQVEQQEQTAGPGYGPLGCINQRTDQPGAHADSFLGGVGLLF